MSSIFKITLVIIPLLWLQVSSAEENTVIKVHPHNGLLAPYGEQPPLLKLDAADLERLSSGTYVIKQTEKGMSGGGIIVQDIDAPVVTVWDIILSFEKYPQWVKQVKSCRPYLITEDRIKVEFNISVLGFGYGYYIDHIVTPSQHYMRWTLDYDRYSELDDVVGFWHATPHPTRPGWTRLYYSTSIKLNGWMPGFLRSFISSKGLKDATAWVKRVSEQGSPVVLKGDDIAVVVRD
jgi:hypothetical protein